MTCRDLRVVNGSVERNCADPGGSSAGRARDTPVGVSFLARSAPCIIGFAFRAAIPGLGWMADYDEGVSTVPSRRRKPVLVATE